ncbi:beta-1,3-galactosyltransferase 6-like [Glandiceps talaboti]
MPRLRIVTIVKILPLIGFIVILLYLSHCNITQNNQQDCPQTKEEKSIDVGGAIIQSDDRKRIKTFLIVMIMTGPKNVDRRNAIRQTWLLNYPTDVTHRFVIGTAGLDDIEIQTLETENSRYNDLLLLQELEDSYKALTRKLLLMYIWLEEKMDFTFVLKADDDTFARINIIVEELRSMYPERLCWGFFDGRAKAKKTTKWAEPDWKLCDYYLPYALGGGYVISRDLIQFIAQNSNYLKLYRNEDVSLGAWLAPIEVNRIHDTRFDTEYKSRGCNNIYIVTHKQSVDMMLEKQKQLNSYNRLCAQEVQTRKSYNYDWNKPPSQCCVRELGLP